jgi:DNA-binding MarR family transcriptional regulator
LPAVKDPAAGPKKVTQPTLLVLALFLALPSRDDWFPLEICRQTGLGSSTVTQILFRLDQWGWVDSRWEDTDVARREGRPRRRFYKVTSEGQRAASRLVHDRLRRLPSCVDGQVRLQVGGQAAPG